MLTEKLVIIKLIVSKKIALKNQTNYLILFLQTVFSKLSVPS